MSSLSNTTVAYFDYEKMAELIRNKQSFRTTGTFTGRAGPRFLTNPDFNKWNNLMPISEFNYWRDVPMAYVIFSYQTPIAWIPEMSETIPDPKWVFTEGPMVRTQTTTKHINLAMRLAQMVDAMRPTTTAKDS